MQNKSTTLLTGIKPTGTPHIGNYLGAISPAIKLAHSYDQSFLFIADYHALNTVQDGRRLHELTLSIAATWLACGLDPSKTTLFRQSSVPEVFEFNTILNSLTPKGWMNKAHAYKAAVDSNSLSKKDYDNGVNMGLYTYPILMAADILLYSTNIVPVGKDQQQHIEIARDIAQKFNHTYNTDALTLPEALIQEKLESIPGLDGRKMSKSYNNIIPLFATNKEWKKLVNSILTDSTDVDKPKETSNSTLFAIYKSLSDAGEVSLLKNQLENGEIGWGHAKTLLIEVLESKFGVYRERYTKLMAEPQYIESILSEGSKKAKETAGNKLHEIRTIIGAQ